MFFRNLFILVCLADAVISTELCVTQSPCKCVLEGGHAIDLSSVGSKGRPRFYQVLSENGSIPDLYSYNPCIPFDSIDPFSSVKPGNVPCKNAAACVRTPGGKEAQLPEEHAIALQETNFGSNDKFGRHINYTLPGPQKLTVKLICIKANETDRLTIDSPETDGNMIIVMTLSSKCACPDGCSASIPSDPQGLSTGSKLLIAFFTILLAYFLVGLVWNFCNGSQGIELIPNLDFWNDFPKLVVEGISFTCSCCGKKRSYGEV